MEVVVAGLQVVVVGVVTMLVLQVVMKVVTVVVVSIQALAVVGGGGIANSSWASLRCGGYAPVTTPHLPFPSSPVTGSNSNRQVEGQVLLRCEELYKELT